MLPGPSRGPGSRKRVSHLAVLGPRMGSDRVLITQRLRWGVVSSVALGLPGRPPEGGVTRYPSRESFVVA